MEMGGYDHDGGWLVYVLVTALARGCETDNLHISSKLRSGLVPSQIRSSRTSPRRLLSSAPHGLSPSSDTESYRPRRYGTERRKMRGRWAVFGDDLLVPLAVSTRPVGPSSHNTWRTLSSPGRPPLFFDALNAMMMMGALPFDSDSESFRLKRARRETFFTPGTSCLRYDCITAERTRRSGECCLA